MNAERIQRAPWKNCPVCGHPVANWEHRCDKCGRRFGALLPRKPDSADRDSKVRVISKAAEITSGTKGTAPTSGMRPQESRPKGPVFPEPLRRQLIEQVQEFRTRRMKPTLPFPSDETAEPENLSPVAEPDPPKVEKQTAAAENPRIRNREPLPMPQSPLVFPESEPGFLHTEFATPPVASFRTRVLAHCLDCAWILAATALFFLPLPLLADEMVFDRYVIGAGVASGCAVALLYGVMFLYLAGETPAMRRMGLRLVNFDGQPASRTERFWRLLGSVASAGSFLLGFLWAAMDDERFSWHDRISRTFLTDSLVPKK